MYRGSSEEYEEQPEEEDAYVDPEKLAAASVIQSGVKGYAARQALRSKKVSIELLFAQ